MLVHTYVDHIAYTFENDESVSPLGNRVMSKMNKDNIMSYNSVSYNGRPRLMYGIEDLKPLSSIIETLPEAEIIVLLRQFLDIVATVNANDFINMWSIDMNFSRLYYDTKLKLLKCVILPVNSECDFHENMTWQDKYRNTLAMFCSQIYSSQPEKYGELFYVIMDKARTEAEITQYLKKYDFGVARVDEVTAHINMVGQQTTTGVLFLEHNSELGNLLFRVTQKEYVVGKSVNNVQGVINISTSVSRKHCVIRHENGNYTIEDLGSSNGTFINGFGIEPGNQYFINNGDVVQVADIVFNVRVE